MKKGTAKLIKEEHERMKILVNYCTRKLNITGMNKSRKPFAGTARGGWRHPVRTFREAVSMKTAIKDSKARQHCGRL